MDVVSIAFLLVLFALPVVAIAAIVWAIRHGSVDFDIRQIYSYLVALVTLFIAFFSAFALIGQVFTLVFPYADPSSDIFTRQQIAGTLGVILAALPVWWFHWRQARQRAFIIKHLLALRIYLYAITLIALIAAVIVAGMAGSGILKAIFSLVDFSSAEGVRIFWRDELSAMVNLLMALLVWFYHWRSAERMPADAGSEGSRV